MNRPLTAELLVQELSNDVLLMDSQIMGKLRQLNIALSSLREENALLKGIMQRKSLHFRDIGIQTDEEEAPIFTSTLPLSFSEVVESAQKVAAMKAQQSVAVSIPISPTPRLSDEEIVTMFPRSPSSVPSSENSSMVTFETLWNSEDSLGDFYVESEYQIERARDEQDFYDYNELQHAIRESLIDHGSETEGWGTVVAREPQKKSEKPPARQPRVRQPSKHVPIALPAEFLGQWQAVKSCMVGKNTKVEWKKCNKNENRVVFKKKAAGGYSVEHKKFSIHDAIFSEQCGGQRCIVTSTGPSAKVLVRHGNTTYTFAMDGVFLLESFKVEGVEYKVLSTKK